MAKESLTFVLIGVYLISLISIGIFSSRRISTDEQLYLGDRSAPWWAIGLSVISTYVGALSFVGAPAWSYTDGLSVLLIHINYPIAIFFVVGVFLPFFYNSGVASIYEYLERRFGMASRILMAIVFLFSNFAYSGIMLYTTALIVAFLTGIDVATIIILVGFFVLIYTSMGGINAVIWTDVLQSAIFIIGSFLVLSLLWISLPEGLLDRLQELQRSDMLRVMDYSLDPSEVSTVWTGLIAMSVYHVVVYGVNQMMVQRTLAAKSMADAKKAYLMMGYVASTIYLIFFGIGVMLFAFYRGKSFEDNNLILLSFVNDFGSPAAIAFVAAAIIAAAMSSLDSSVNSMATISNVDFLKRFERAEKTPKYYLRTTRIFTAFWALAAIVPALLLIGSDGSVLELLSKFGSFFVGAKLSMYLLGFYSRHATERGVLFGVVAGFVVLAMTEMFLDIAWPWYALIGGGVSIAVGLLCSLILDGFQDAAHELSIEGQKLLFVKQGRVPSKDGWYLIPGVFDKQSYWLLVFFVSNILIAVSFGSLYL